MSRSAGTLITTNNATYIPPRFQPGYMGYIPTMKFDYGETFPNATAKYFQDYRSESLKNSISNYHQGGYFPSHYTHNPDLLIDNRTRSRDRWLSGPRYSLTNVDHDKQREYQRFDGMTQAHRDQFRDRSGTLPRVNLFVMPMSAEDQIKQYVPFMIHSNRYTDAVHIPNSRHLARRRPITQAKPDRPTWRERQMRDEVFEKR